MASFRTAYAVFWTALTLLLVISVATELVDLQSHHSHHDQHDQILSERPPIVVAVLTPMRTGSTLLYNAVRILLTMYDPNTLHFFAGTKAMESAMAEISHWEQQNISIVLKSHNLQLLEQNRSLLQDVGVTHLVTARRNDLYATACSFVRMKGVRRLKVPLLKAMAGSCRNMYKFRRACQQYVNDSAGTLIDFNYETEIKEVPLLLSKLNRGLNLQLSEASLEIASDMLQRLRQVAFYKGAEGEQRRLPHHPVTFIHKNHVSDKESGKSDEQLCGPAEELLSQDFCKAASALLDQDLSNV